MLGFGAGLVVLDHLVLFFNSARVFLSVIVACSFTCSFFIVLNIFMIVVLISYS